MFNARTIKTEHSPPEMKFSMLSFARSVRYHRVKGRYVLHPSSQPRTSEDDLFPILVNDLRPRDFEIRHDWGAVNTHRLPFRLLSRAPKRSWDGALVWMWSQSRGLSEGNWVEHLPTGYVSLRNRLYGQLFSACDDLHSTRAIWECSCCVLAQYDE